MRWLIVPTMLLVAVPLQKNCGTVKVDGPKTAECPEGRYIVTADQTQDPPVVSYRCEKPAPGPSASPVPEPSVAPSVSPRPLPSGTPRPSPTPTSTPAPSTSPSPAASPSPASGGLTDACPAPFAVKLGFGQNPRALNPGFANTASITPLVANTETNRQPCAHKGLGGPSDTCAADEGCGDHVGSPYEVVYGQPPAFQSLAGGFQGDPVERSTDDCTVIVDGVPHVPCGYNLRFATACHRETDKGPCVNYPGGRYNEAGPMRICASLPNLPTWRCQTGTMGEDGKLDGFGQDNRSTDVPK